MNEENLKKECKGCKEMLPLSSFYKHERAKDGLKYKCKSCDNARTREWQHNNRERVLTRSRKYLQTAKGKSVKIASFNKQKLTQPEKYKGRYLTKSLVKTGKITKQTCGACGEVKVEAHHYNGYDKVYDIIWLCHWHHSQLHKAMASLLHSKEKEIREEVITKYWHKTQAIYTKEDGKCDNYQILTSVNQELAKELEELKQKV